MYRKKIGNTDHISEWKSKGLSDEIVKPPSTNNNRLAPKLSYVGNKTRLKLNGSCLKQDKITYTHGAIVKIYIAYELSSNLNYNENITLENCLFGAVTLIKNADISKNKYSGYGIGFDRHETFLFPSGGFGKNVIIFGVDMSSSVHVDNKQKDILILVVGPTQELDGTTLTAKKMYSINFTVTKRQVFLSLHYNGSNSYLFANGTEIIKFKVNVSEIVARLLCLGNSLEDFSVNNMKKIRLFRYVYDI